MGSPLPRYRRYYRGQANRQPLPGALGILWPFGEFGRCPLEQGKTRRRLCRHRRSSSGTQHKDSLGSSHEPEVPLPASPRRVKKRQEVVHSLPQSGHRPPGRYPHQWRPPPLPLRIDSAPFPLPGALHHGSACSNPIWNRQSPCR